MAASVCQIGRIGYKQWNYALFTRLRSPWLCLCTFERTHASHRMIHRSYYRLTGCALNTFYRNVGQKTLVTVHNVTHQSNVLTPCIRQCRRTTHSQSAKDKQELIKQKKEARREARLQKLKRKEEAAAKRKPKVRQNIRP